MPRTDTGNVLCGMLRYRRKRWTLLDAQHGALGKHEEPGSKTRAVRLHLHEVSGTSKPGDRDSRVPGRESDCQWAHGPETVLN